MANHSIFDDCKARSAHFFSKSWRIYLLILDALIIQSHDSLAHLFINFCQFGGCALVIAEIDKFVVDLSPSNILCFTLHTHAH